MKSRRYLYGVFIFTLLLEGGLAFAAGGPKKAGSCSRDQSNGAACTESPVAGSRRAMIQAETGTPEAPEERLCEDYATTITALQQTVTAMNATLSALPAGVLPDSAMTGTPPPTLTVPPTATFTLTPGQTYTPPPTFTPSVMPSDTPSPTPNPAARLWDEFDDPQGWELPDGAAIQDGVLQVTGNNEMLLVQLPIEPLDEFYVMVDARLKDDAALNASIVFMFGAIPSDQSYYYITFNKDFVDVFEVVEGRNQFVSSAQTPVERFDTWQRIGISYRDGQLEVYLNSDLLMITDLPSTGAQLALGGQFSESTSNNTVYFDRLEVLTPQNGMDYEDAQG